MAWYGKACHGYLWVQCYLVDTSLATFAAVHAKFDRLDIAIVAIIATVAIVAIGRR